MPFYPYGIINDSVPNYDDEGVIFYRINSPSGPYSAITISSSASVDNFGYVEMFYTFNIKQDLTEPKIISILFPASAYSGFYQWQFNAIGYNVEEYSLYSVDIAHSNQALYWYVGFDGTKTALDLLEYGSFRYVEYSFEISRDPETYVPIPGQPDEFSVTVEFTNGQGGGIPDYATYIPAPYGAQNNFLSNVATFFNFAGVLFTDPRLLAYLGIFAGAFAIAIVVKFVI